jgi:hypothetical protein
MSILQLVQTSPTNWEAWEYRPGQAPKRRDDINFNPKTGCTATEGGL